MRRLIDIKLKNISFSLLIIFFLDSVLHIGRHLTSSGNDFLRLPLLIILFFTCISFLQRNKAFFMSYYTQCILLLVLLLFISYVKAVLLNQNIELANDFLLPFIYFSFFPIFVYSIQTEEDLFVLVRIIIITGTVISIGMLILVISSVVNLKVYNMVSDFMEFFELGYALGGAEGVIRFLPKGVAVQIMAYFFSFYYILRAYRKYLLLILINGFAVFLTFTRGLWLGLFVGTLFLLIKYKTSGFSRNHQVTKIIYLGIILVILTIFGVIFLNPDIFTFAFARISGESYTSSSDDLRKVMTRMLNELISEHIAWGGGAGIHINLRDGRVEMTYHDVISKIGMIGLVILLMPFIAMFNDNKGDKNNFKLIQICMLSSLVSILVATYTNPYFITSFGVFLYCLCMRVYSYRRFPFNKKTM